MQDNHIKLLFVITTNKIPIPNIWKRVPHHVNKCVLIMRAIKVTIKGTRYQNEYNLNHDKCDSLYTGCYFTYEAQKENFTARNKGDPGNEEFQEI